jgi:hypothetical protein
MLNLKTLEDLFYCIDVLTRVKFSIKENEQSIVNEIDTLLDTFISLSEKLNSNSAEDVKPASAGNITEDNVKPASSDDITDIFTGEAIQFKGSNQ